MKPTKKLSLLVSLVAAAALLSGCQSKNDGYAAYKNENSNFLGLVQVRPNSYYPTQKATFQVSTDELWAREDFSGNNVELLWGAFTYTDY